MNAKLKEIEKHGDRFVNSEANAKLIAAAPEMAEALHSARCALDVFLSGELSEASAVERLAIAATIVTAALAKADLC